jgi:hypothetical protein
MSDRPGMSFGGLAAVAWVCAGTLALAAAIWWWLA